jgi:hypothetical protein
MSETPSPPRLWRTHGPTPPGAGRRSRLLAVLLVLTVFAGIGAALLYWMAPAREVAVLPVSVTTAPWGEQDRAAIVSTSALGRPLDDGSANPNRDQIRLRFAALAKAPRSQPVVIHFAAPAAVDAAGSVFLLPADATGDSPRNRLTLAELLAALRDCPAKHKLLILNLTPHAEDPLFAPPAGDLSAAVFATLEAVPDDTRLSLVACGPGQAPFASPELGRSVFSFYLEAGLKGAADDDRDNRVSVRELAGFVRTRVNRWTLENRGVAQTPVLVGTAPDFVLRSYPHPEQAEEKAVGEIAYPDWLKAGWESLDRWKVDGRATSAQWAYRQARNALLAAERDLRAGHSADEVKRTLDQQLAGAEQLAASLRAVPTPDPLPALAAVYPGYALPDPAIVEQLRATAIAVEAKPVPPPAKPDEKPTEPPLAPEFDAFKAKPHPLVAAAAFLVLAEDPDVSPTRVKAFAKLLAAQEPQVKFAEVLLIRRLAALADQGALAPWSGERPALAIQTARFVEDTSVRLEVIASAKPALDEAYRLRADAVAVLFSPGYAPPEVATARLRAAEAAARKLKLAADRLHAAIATRDDAVLWLTGATALVNSGTVNATEAAAVADAVVKLNALLPQGGQQFNLDGFSDRVPNWDRAVSNLRLALATANRPLTPESLAALRKRAGYADAGPPVVAELDAVLASPLVPVADRVLLWNARSALSRRLCEVTLRKDSADDEAFRNGSPRPVTAEPQGEEAYDAALAQRRARWTVSLLRAGGVGAEGIEAELEKVSRDRFAFADRLRRVWVEDAPVRRHQATASLAAVLPVSPATASLDSPATNPLSVWRRAAAQQLWAWQTARFEYEAHDSVDGTAFLLAAAKSCSVAANASAFPYVEIAPTAIPRLTFEKPSAELKLNLRAVGGQSSANVRALTPSTEWLKPVPPVSAKLDPIRESAVTLPLAAGGKPTSYPTALGVLVEADAVFEGGRRTFHRRVPVSLRTLANRVDLLIRTDPKAAPQPLAEFRVRPNGVPVSYQFVLLNPSPVPQKVIARLAGLNRETAPLTLEPGKPVPLVFASTAPPAPVVAPPAAGANVKPDDGFRPLGDNALSLELLDPADKESVLQTFALPVAVADPASYLRVSGAAFSPGGDGRLNQLSMTVVPGDIPTAAPCPVKMVFPPRLNKGLLVRDGSQASSVVGAGKSVKLYTENLAFPSPIGANVVVTLSADGVERVFTYAASLPTLGETVQLQPVSEPRVWVDAPEYARGDVPLPVTLEVDNAPTGSRLELLIGTAKDAASPVSADLMLPIATARARVVRFRFDPKGEAFELVGSLTDHKPVLPVELLTGKRTLEARLIAPDGKEIAKHRVTVTFDGNAPTDVRFLDLPPKAAKGQPLALKATCGPTVSGIKEVKFFVGKPNGMELPASPAPLPGVLPDGSTEWRATLQMPDTKGIVIVGVKFTTHAGLSTIETQEIELADAAELNKPAPGAIAGKLLENRIPQPNAVVFLYDAKGNPLAKTTTKADGTFAFKELPPGSYYLFSEKVATNRIVKEAVDVKAGETTAKTLELLLK